MLRAWNLLHVVVRAKRVFVIRLSEPDNDTFAAPVASVESVTTVVTATGEREFRDVRRIAAAERPVEVPWSSGMAVQMPGCTLAVPETAVRAVREPESERIDFFDQHGGVVATVTIERDTYGRTTAIVLTTGSTVTARLSHRYFDDERHIDTTRPSPSLGWMSRKGVARATSAVSSLPNARLW